MAELSSWLIDLVFPIKCIGCQRFSESYLCASCRRNIPLKAKFECIGCKRKVTLGLTCNACIKDYAVDQLLVAADYKNLILEKALKLYKYRFISDLGPPIGNLLIHYSQVSLKNKGYNLFGNNPLLIPVPLSKSRLNWRGFNQAGLLADSLAEKFQLQVETGAIGRKFSHLHQADIEDRNLRLENVKKAFSMINSKNISGRNIILIDDICTTGGTLNECAKVLKANGALKITGLVVARG